MTVEQPKYAYPMNIEVHDPRAKCLPGDQRVMVKVTGADGSMCTAYDVNAVLAHERVIKAYGRTPAGRVV